MKTLITLLALLAINACTYHKNLENHNLVVPPFVQTENPELYKVFQPKKK